MVKHNYLQITICSNSKNNTTALTSAALVTIWTDFVSQSVSFWKNQSLIWSGPTQFSDIILVATGVLQKQASAKLFVKVITVHYWLSYSYMAHGLDMNEKD